MSINRPEKHLNVAPDALPEHVTRVDEAFDKTSMGQARAEGLLDNHVPDYIQDVIDTADPAEANFLENPIAPPTPNHRRRNLLIGASATLAAGLLATGAFLGLKGSGEGAPHLAETVPPNPTASAPVTPGEKPAPTAEAWTTESLKLDGSLTPQQLGTTLGQDRLSAWEIVGATPENLDAYLGTSGNIATLDAIANQNGDVIADAIFVPNWRDDPSLLKWVTHEKQINVATLAMNFKTTYAKSSVVADKQPYVSGVKVESTTVVSQTADSVSISSAATEWDNANMNSAIQWSPDIAKINGNKLTINTTFTLVKGIWKISALDITGRN